MAWTDQPWLHADLMPGASGDEFWSAFDARSEEARGYLVDRFRLTDVTFEALEAGQEDGRRARLSFRLEDSMRAERLDELWMQALSAELPDEQVHLMHTYEQFALSEEPGYGLDAPRAVLQSLVGRIRALEDGNYLLIGGDDGVVLRCSDGGDQLVDGDGAPVCHHWLFARHGEVVMIDSTFLDNEVYVSRANLMGVLAAC